MRSRYPVKFWLFTALLGFSAALLVLNVMRQQRYGNNDHQIVLWALQVLIWASQLGTIWRQARRDEQAQARDHDTQ